MYPTSFAPTFWAGRGSAPPQHMVPHFLGLRRDPDHTLAHSPPHLRTDRQWLGGMDVTVSGRGMIVSGAECNDLSRRGGYAGLGADRRRSNDSGRAGTARLRRSRRRGSSLNRAARSQNRRRSLFKDGAKFATTIRRSASTLSKMSGEMLRNKRLRRPLAIHRLCIGPGC
jgi:hypothetical protein